MRGDSEIEDFAIQVDVSDFFMTPESEAGLIARTQFGTALGGYVAGVSLGKANATCLPGQLWIRKMVNGVSQPLAERCPATVFLAPNAANRLQFSGTGNRLTLKLTQPERPDLTVEPLVVEDASFTQGDMGLWLSLPSPKSKVTVDNFRAAGTLPE
jgi:hypothetical protein